MSKQLTESFLIEKIQILKAQEQQALATANAASGAIQALEMLRSELFAPDIQKGEVNGESHLAR